MPVICKCKEEGCDGNVQKEDSHARQIGCNNYDIAYRCDQCGRLHWANGNPVINRREEKVFIVDGKLVHKNQANEITYQG